MSVSTLAFAENLTYHYDDSSDDHPLKFLCDDEAFPPLNSTATGFEMVHDDVQFAGESTVWVNAFSYAQAAENGGVIHEPINISSIHNISPAGFKNNSPTRKSPTVDNNYGDDDDNCLDALYFDIKSLSTDKAVAENTIYARKLKTAKYTYDRDLRKNLLKLPKPSCDMTHEDAEKVQDAKAMVAGCDKIATYLDMECTKHYYRNHFHSKRKIKDWHNICRQHALRAYSNDPIIERLYDEFEKYVHHRLPLFRGGPNRLTSSCWYHYHRMRSMGFQHIRMYYDSVIQDTEGVDPTISRKERLWLIRSSIPGTKYMDPKTTRTKCAYTILDEWDQSL
ncbi:hypothetical protein BJV82DRAFT_634132 [Fennellomyces sp. T-0311]|nr:hypothetical protein BJV82DRAFT_634132 [Fennellomyces sp. T-0311]